MNEIISEIFDNYGLLGLGLFVAAMIALSSFIKNGTRLLGMMRWPHISFKPPLNVSLRDHIFFSNTEFKLAYDIPALRLLPDNPTLERVYIDLAYITVESFYYGSKSLIRNPEIGTMTAAKWDTVVNGSINSMVRAIETKGMNIGIPPPILNGYMRWTSSYIDLLKSYVTQMSNSVVYGDGIIRTNTFLLVMNLLVIAMVGDIERLARTTDSEDLSGIFYHDRELEV